MRHPCCNFRRRHQMIRRYLLVLIGTWFIAGAALAQPCGSYPYPLVNGTTADADQVMANFNHVLNCATSGQSGGSSLRGWIAGLTMSNDGTSPNTVIDTSTGAAASADATTLMTLATAFTK